MHAHMVQSTADLLGSLFTHPLHGGLQVTLLLQMCHSGTEGVCILLCTLADSSLSDLNYRYRQFNVIKKLVLRSNFCLCFRCSIENTFLFIYILVYKNNRFIKLNHQSIQR